MDALLLSSKQYDRVLEGVVTTVQLLGASFVLGVVLSLLFGVARLSDRSWVRGAALVYVEFARGISTIVLLFIMAYAIPILLGLEQSNVFWLATVALGVNMGGYGAEIIRGAILSVPKGQTEAAKALSLGYVSRMRDVILPQAIKISLPATIGFLVQLIKGTSLAAIVGFTELARAGTIVSNQIFKPLLVFGAVGALYFLICWPLSLYGARLERRLAAASH